jgi:signal transduction histidine kinase
MEFKDTGRGMSQEVQRQAFTTVLGTTKAKGTGLGLAIVGRIIETHHGQIRILSRPGHGTTLRITLPVK